MEELRAVPGGRELGRAAVRKSGRIREFQAILPLRGKIINAYKSREDKVLDNAEIQAMIQAIGTGIGADQDLTRLRYNKIIIMTDADVDGSHIRTLLLCFFYRQMYQLVAAGHVYVAQPPLYRIKKGKSEKYIKDDREFTREILRRATENAAVETNGGRLEGAELRTFLMQLDEFQQVFRKAERRFRQTAVVEAIANPQHQIDSRADFAQAANLKPVLAQLREANVPAELRPDEEHAAWMIVYQDPTHAETQF
jgi:DNA gyrase subunit B